MMSHRLFAGLLLVCSCSSFFSLSALDYSYAAVRATSRPPSFVPACALVPTTALPRKSSLIGVPFSPTFSLSALSR
jgi:hypothetical protein